MEFAKRMNDDFLILRQSAQKTVTTEAEYLIQVGPF